MRYSIYNSPLGKITVKATEKGLSKLSWNSLTPVESQQGKIVSVKDIFPGFGKSLHSYFKGYREDFDYPIDLSSIPIFVRRVLEEIRKIPYARTTTYSEIAKSLGKPNTQRAVGKAAGLNPLPIVIPCHRILAKKVVGGYTLGIGTKLWLLYLEKAGIFYELVSIVKRLRKECPWDSIQTHESLAPFIREECEEVITAIEKKEGLKGELGDLLLQILLQSEISEDFSILDVCEVLAHKLKARHSHIFGRRKAKTPEDVKRIWEEEKAKGN